jgi:hypothetical protein
MGSGGNQERLKDKTQDSKRFIKDFITVLDLKDGGQAKHPSR